MKKWIVLTLVLACAGLALASRWWLAPFLTWLGAKSDLIQGLASLIQILLWVGAAVVAFVGWRQRKPAPSSPEPRVATRGPVHQTGSGALAVGQGNAVAGAGGVAIARDLHGDVHIHNNPPPSPREAHDTLLRRYLQWLIDDCAPLKLKAIDQAAAKPGSTPLGLTSIYVDLSTDLRIPEKQTLPQHLEAERRAAGDSAKHPSREREILEREQRGEEKKTRLVPVLECLGTHDRLIVLGAPGSGKSTLTAYVALSLAQASLDQTAALDRLGQWWKFGPLLPIRVVLRQFAANLDAPKTDAASAPHAAPSPQPSPPAGERVPEGRVRGRAKDLWDFLETELERLGLPRETAAALRQHAADQGALFLFDGLDEARDTATRLRVLQAVAEFTKTAGKKCRFLLTSRPYAWQEFQPPAGQPQPPEHAAILAELPQAYRLAEFDPEQIQTFITHWYAAVKTAGWLTEADARDKAANLQQAVTRADLVALARNPLLLTLMATLHSNRTRLPDDRADLYNEVVELLLQRWNEKSGDDRGLLDALAVPHLKLSDLREVMQQLAFEAHAAHTGKDGVADIPEGVLLAALRPLLANDTGKADLALDYIEKRAGLLLGQGERGRQRQYTFPHRTFQEYLAACHLAGLNGFCQRACDLAHENAAHWREVLTLAARQAKAGRGVPAADALVRCQSVESWLAKHAATEGDWRAAVLAGEQLLEIGLAAVESREEFRAVKERVAGWLVAALEGRAVRPAGLLLEGESDKGRRDALPCVLPPSDRAKAGGVLARLGDERPGVGVKNGLPDIDWIEIPEGPFLMGNDKPAAKYDDEVPQFTCDLIRQPYRISRYPVTVAQFEAFVQAGGYREPKFWTQAGWKWKGDRTRPEDYDPVFQTCNHPRVGVSWYEALAFCRWLTACRSRREEAQTAREEGASLPRLLQGYEVRLTSEAEWERAARHTDGRVYPWGNSAEDVAQRCNMGQTGLDHTSPVGMFATGHSVAGVADMAGNVWEWTRTLWGKDWQKPAFRYPYNSQDGRESSEAGPEVLRVLRGGAFVCGADGVRCASRYGDIPGFRDRGIGFRLVASPFVSER